MFDYIDMTDDELFSFVNAHEFRFAKSMPKMPHWYVVRENCRDDQEFCRIVMHIRKHGVPKPFWKKTYIYLVIGDFEYWTMGNPLWDTTILNRAIVK